MKTTAAYGLAVTSVTLTAIAQLLLKAGVVKLMANEGLTREAIVWSAVTSPFLVLGLFCFGCSVVVWLAVLAHLDVSQAYPFVSLGIILTMLGGNWFFGEPLNAMRLLGGVVVVAGVLLVARS